MAVSEQSRGPRLQPIRCKCSASPQERVHAKVRACSFLRASLAVASNQAGASLELKGRSARARDRRWDSSTAVPRTELAGVSSSWQGGRSAEQGGREAEQKLSDRCVARQQHTGLARGQCI